MFNRNTGIFFNQKKSHKQHLTAELKDIATGSLFKPLLERITELTQLSKDSLVDLLGIMSANQQCVLGNKSLIDLILLEKLAKKRALNEEEKSLFSQAIFILKGHIGIYKEPSFISINLLIKQGSSVMLLFPDALYQEIPAMFREHLPDDPKLSPLQNNLYLV